MSILIKDMEMPTSCFNCFARRKIDPDNIRCLVTGDVFEETFAWTIEKRMSSCPLVSVPPHGDLIDRHKVGLTDFEIILCNGDYKEGMIMLLDQIDSLPTIIPAEEGE